MAASNAAVSRRLLFASHGRRACSTVCLVRQPPVDQSPRQRRFSTSLSAAAAAVTRGHRHRRELRRVSISRSGVGEVPAAMVDEAMRSIQSTWWGFATRSSSTCPSAGTPLLTPAGPLFGRDNIAPGDESADSDYSDEVFIPQVNFREEGVGGKKRVLVLCTGGTLTSEF